jgi:REP element-mobilizing transposase RayT
MVDLPSKVWFFMHNKSLDKMVEAPIKGHLHYPKKMTSYNPDIHHRHSIRLREYDYSNAGACFMTFCAQNREYLFGEIVDGKVILNDAGRMVEKWWRELTKIFPSVKTDAHIVMPNHFHGIIMIGVGADLRVCPVMKNGHDSKGAHTGAPLQRIVQWFKTMVTNEYLRGVKRNELLPMPGRLWQRNYYEHIIRTEDELNRLREYVINNPAQWSFDNENPDCDRGEQSRRGEPAARPYIG